MSKFLQHYGSLVVLATVIVAFGVRDYEHGRSSEALRNKLAHQTIITKNAQGIAASTEADNKALKDLLEAAKKLNANLIAGAIISVPEKKVTIVHDTVPTLAVDGHRTADITDTTDAGILQATLTAPPYPAALGFKYTLIQPAFAPAVGFAEKDGVGYAIVSWKGQTYEIKSPYVKPVVKVRHLLPYAAGFVEPSGVLSASAGVELRGPWGLTVVTEAEQRLVVGEPTRAKLGIKKYW